MDLQKREELAERINADGRYKLKPCPFCGGVAKFEIWEDNCAVVRCTNCLIMTTQALVSNQLEYQMNVWNRRKEI